MEQVKEIPTIVKLSYVGIMSGTVIFPVTFVLAVVFSASYAPLVGLTFLSFWMWWKLEISRFLTFDHMHHYFDIFEIREKQEVPNILKFFLLHRNNVERTPVDYFSLFGIMVMLVMGFVIDMNTVSLFWFSIACAVSLVVGWGALLLTNAGLNVKIQRQKEEFEKIELEEIRKKVLDRIKEIEDNKDSSEEK